MLVQSDTDRSISDSCSGAANVLLAKPQARTLRSMKEWLPLVGVVVAQFVLVFLYFLKQRADDKRRWHEKRLDAYRELSQAGRTASAVFASAEGAADLDDRRFVTAMNDGDACQLDIGFLATDLVREKAGYLQTLLEMCVVFDPTDDGFPSAADLITARGDFESSVRQELGIDRKRTFVVVADSRGQLIWRSIELLLATFYGSFGRTAAQGLKARFGSNADAGAGSSGIRKSE